MPSDGRSVKFRPFTVKERSILLVALQSEDTKSILNAINELFKVCTFGVCELEKMPIVDSEYLFIQIRNKSVGEELEVTHTCSCKNKNDIRLNMDKIEIVGSEVNRDIELMPNVWVKMNYPTFKNSSILSSEPTEDEVIAVIASCMHTIIKGDEVFKVSEFAFEDVKEFILSLTQPQLDKIENFFASLPKVVINGEYTCRHCDTHHVIRIEGLENFFD
jgi:hypothetical protein